MQVVHPGVLRRAGRAWGRGVLVFLIGLAGVVASACGRAGRPEAAAAPGPEAGSAAPTDPAPAGVGGGAPEQIGRPGGPVASAEALRGLGRLALVWNGRVYVLDGGSQTVRPVSPAGARAAAPAWSPDGEWLAYLQVEGEAERRGTVRVVRADGSQDQAVAALPAAVSLGRFAWSPASGVLAIAPDGAGKGGGLWLAEPGKPPRLVAAEGQTVNSFAWSPDGQTLAYAVTLPYDPQDVERRSDALYTVPAAGGEPTRRHVAAGAGIRIAGWWPDGRGLLFWPEVLHSASLAADGLVLTSLPLGGGKPRPLVTTLAYPDWISWSADGKRVVVVQGGGRETWKGKSLAVCTVLDGACRELPQPPGTVALDPAWSPTEERIAFVRAAASDAMLSGKEQVERWQASRELWVGSIDLDTTGALRWEAHRLDSAGGASRPLWSRDGRRLLYVRDGALWTVSATGGAPVRAVRLPAPPDTGVGYYGHVSWTESVAWYRGW